jgi:thiol:disulfide interchange protein DsbG
MRPLIVMAALVWSPALAASPPLCTMPAPAAIPIADDLAEELTNPSPPATSADVPNPLPGALASMPFVQHIASAGAVVRDLGPSHGMRAIAARSGDQCMLFQVTPDGQAAVSGATVELSPAQLETIASGNITDLGVQHALQGFFVRSGPQFQVFYATPDNERLIPGVLWNAAGKDLTGSRSRAFPARSQPWWLAAPSPGSRAPPHRVSQRCRSCRRPLWVRSAKHRRRACSC